MTKNIKNIISNKILITILILIVILGISLSIYIIVVRNSKEVNILSNVYAGNDLDFTSEHIEIVGEVPFFISEFNDNMEPDGININISQDISNYNKDVKVRIFWSNSSEFFSAENSVDFSLVDINSKYYVPLLKTQFSNDKFFLKVEFINTKNGDVYNVNDFKIVSRNSDKYPIHTEYDYNNLKSLEVYDSNDLVYSDGIFAIEGNDPYIIINNLQIIKNKFFGFGYTINYFSNDTNNISNVYAQVYWTTEKHGFLEKYSFSFEFDNNQNVIVPIEACDSFIEDDSNFITRVRIDFRHSNGNLTIKDLQFYQSDDKINFNNVIDEYFTEYYIDPHLKYLWIIIIVSMVFVYMRLKNKSNI